jgi:hypothetical protein
MADDRELNQDGPTLPEEARRQLGRALRSNLDADAGRPAYLGDPVTPPEFEDQVSRLRSRLTARAQGPAAVEDALTDLLKR